MKLTSAIKLNVQPTYPVGVCMVNGSEQVVEIINDEKVRFSEDVALSFDELEKATMNRSRYELKINGVTMRIKPRKLTKQQSIVSKEEVIQSLINAYKLLYNKHKQSAVTMFIILTEQHFKIDSKEPDTIVSNKTTLDAKNQILYLAEVLRKMPDQELEWNINRELTLSQYGYHINASNGRYILTERD
jgi:hypothetical protein